MCGLVSILLAFAVGAAVSGCGGQASDTGTNATTASSTVTTTGGSSSTTGNVANMNGDQLGEAAGAIWSDTMQRLVALMGSKPEAASVKTQVEQLREENIQKLVAIGRQAAALGDSDRAQMRAKLSSVLQSTAGEGWYVSYMDIFKNYSAGDTEFSNLLASFNTLTQYADFELLKQQAPEEASRLGIQ